MSKKKARLGRGLDALLGVTAGNLEQQPSVAGEMPAPQPAERTDQLREIPVEQLQRGAYQPRSHMDQEALEELAASIRAQGVVQPVLVRPRGPGSYELIAGERRWRAAQLAGLAKIPAVIRDVPDEAAMTVGLIENIQRENLNPVEEARGLQRLLDEFGLTHQEVAEAIGRSRAAVSNLLRLLSLHSVACGYLESGALDMGHGRALLALPLEQQPEAAKSVVDRSLSVRQTERLVKRLLNSGMRIPELPRDPDIVRLEEDLSLRIGATVRIQHGSKKGRLVIEYHGLDELDGILGRIR
ncbi:MAG: ParB/RepB/Spo0J family partition protein [Pseudomonadota bacterium]|nr:ParB/RepB/Spo0J family partition protein [Pseudomonadota bacterium]